MAQLYQSPNTNSNSNLGQGRWNQNQNQNQKASKKSMLTPSRPSDPVSNLAIIFTIKRLALVFTPTLLCLIVPPLIYVSLRLLDNVSSGYGFSCIVISSGIMFLTKAQIKKSAPSQTKQQEALQFCDRLFVPLLLSCLFGCRFLFKASSERTANVNHARYDFYFASIAFGWRLALGLFFLSCLVCLRHVSLFGIAQCSIYPLPNNPYEKIFYTLSSFNRILDKILAPDDPKHAKEEKTMIDDDDAVFPRSKKQGPKRYRQPSLGKIMVQIILHCFFGALFSKSVVVPILVVQCWNSSSTNNVIIGHMIVSCTFLSCCTFLTTYFTNNEYAYRYKYHELSPNFVTRLNWNTMWSTAVWKQIQQSGILFYWMIMPIISFGVATWVYGDETKRTLGYTTSSMVASLLMVYSVTFLMVVYILAIDHISRVCVLQPGLNMDKFIARNMNILEVDVPDGPDGPGPVVSVEDVIVESLMGGFGVELFENLISPRLTVGKDGTFSKPGKIMGGSMGGGGGSNYDLEQEEVERNNVITSIIAETISRGDVCGYRSFEIDLLTLGLLECLGGESKQSKSKSSTPSPSRNNNFPLGLSRRHYWYLHRRLTEVDPSQCQLAQPPIVPVLRALCAYMGAIGSTCTTCISSSSTSSSSLSIPPCTPFAAMLSLRASCRLIVLNMNVSVTDLSSLSSGGGGGVHKKRYNRISLMLPVVLESIHRLRNGILDHVRHKYETDHSVMASVNRMGGTSPSSSSTHNNNSIRTITIDARTIQDVGTFESYLAVKYTSLSHVVSCCDVNAAMVMKALKEVDGVDGVKDLESVTKTSVGCQEWLMSL